MDEPAAPESTAVAPPPRARRRIGWRPLRWIFSTVLLVVLALGAGIAFLSSPLALELLRSRAIHASEGRLSIEGAEGSVLSTVRLGRIAWHGDEIDVAAEEVALTWRPTDLLSKRFNVDGLGAKRLVIALRPSTGSTTLPADLKLPLEVNIRNAGVQDLALSSGATQLVVQGLAFSYAGGAREHTLTNLRFVTKNGTLAGNLSLGAAAPFAVAANLAFAGDGPFRNADATLDAKGSLSRLAVAVKGTFNDAAGTGELTVAPLEAVPLLAAKLDLRGVDLARFHAILPVTRLDVALTAQPTPSGLSGSIDARNANVGTIDAGRVPLTALAAQFAWDGREVALDGINAQLPRGGRATGSAVIPLDGAPTRWTLAIRDLDLAGVNSALASTRLSGTVRADVAGARQVVVADLAQDGMSVRFNATVAGRAIEVASLDARAGASTVSGRGRIHIDGTRPFEFTGETHDFDPARFGAFPSANLDATITASGVLTPEWRVALEVAVKDGSRLEKAPLSGTLRGSFTRDAFANAALALKYGTSVITASGAAGTPDARLAFKADIPNLAEIEPWLARYAPPRLRAHITGKLRTAGSLVFASGIPGFAIDVHAENLAIGTAFRAGAIDGRATVEAARDLAGAMPLSGRKITLNWTATAIGTAPADLKSARGDATGTIEHHVANFAVTGEGFATQASVSGSLASRSPGKDSDFVWSASVTTLVNEGTHPVRLTAPAVVEISSDRIRVSSAKFAVSDGAAQLDEFLYANGRIETTGRFNGVPVGTLARFARVSMPLSTTLLIGGEWVLHATPRLNGTLNVHREGGDFYFGDGPATAPNERGFGTTELALDAKWTDDAVDARARFRSTRAGTADATLQITAVAGAEPLFISSRAPINATLTADLPTLRPLQPLLGTAGVADGHASMSLTATGTLAAPVLSGKLDGDSLRLDFPVYGMHFLDGKLRAVLNEGKLTLEELSFAGGDGRFNAHGTLTLPARGAAMSTATSHIVWDAKELRILNRPDLRIVGSGSGTLALAGRKLLLAGKVAIDSGRVEYRATDDGRLSHDVVIVGQPRREPPRAMGEDLPLALDLQLALGDELQFSGEGFDARLGGQLHLLTLPSGVLQARGTFYAVNGTYFAFGQRLTIQRGRLIFDGPIDNPALDIIALRTNAQVEAGLEITGTVRNPHVRLTSNPPVPDNEKLSWLLTGQGLDRASRADIAAISAASLSLLSKDRRPVTTTFAQAFGLDDISVRQSSVARTTGSPASQVVAFGKRLTDNMTLIYEQGLTVATNALRIEYALSRTLTLRAEAGVVSSIGIVYRRSFD